MGQIGSGLLLVGFSALFIGGLGVFNSVKAYLDGKLATLRALGLRDARLAALVLLQILMLALAASLGGAVLGGALALAGMRLVAGMLPVAASAWALVAPLAAAVAFGVLTALAFALPALGRALAVSPAALFRGIDGNVLRTPRGTWLGTALAGGLRSARSRMAAGGLRSSCAWRSRACSARARRCALRCSRSGRR
jgi:putative ABC transport system permease protein